MDDELIRSYEEMYENFPSVERIPDGKNRKPYKERIERDTVRINDVRRRIEVKISAGFD